jgi:hypothetical protein
VAVVAVALLTVHLEAMVEVETVEVLVVVLVALPILVAAVVETGTVALVL